MQYQTCVLCDKEFPIDNNDWGQRICNSCEMQADMYYEERKEEEAGFMCVPPEDLEAR